MNFKIVVISDTHGMHEQLGALSGDVLVHCGDMCNGFHNDSRELDRIDAWFASLEFNEILCIGGNHDIELQERARHVSLGKRYRVLEHATYLEDQTYEYRGIRFYGAPWVPQLRGWAFYKDNEGLQESWRKIPENVDVLLTHTPPRMVLDLPRSGQWNLGCPWLARELERVRPKLHCFGHVHGSYGVENRDGLLYVNGSSATTRKGRYAILNPPVLVEWYGDDRLHYKFLKSMPGKSNSRR